MSNSSEYQLFHKPKGPQTADISVLNKGARRGEKFVFVHGKTKHGLQVQEIRFKGEDELDFDFVGEEFYCNPKSLTFYK